MFQVPPKGRNVMFRTLTGMSAPMVPGDGDGEGVTWVYWEIWGVADDLGGTGLSSEICRIYKPVFRL